MRRALLCKALNKEERFIHKGMPFFFDFPNPFMLPSKKSRSDFHLNS